MKFEIGIAPDNDNAQSLNDHLQARLRELLKSSSSRGDSDADGSYTSSLTGPFPIGDSEVVLMWTLKRLPDGTLDSLEVVALEDSDVDWEAAVNEIWEGVKTDALAANREKFFEHQLYRYIGPQLSGEYWLPGFRFAPAYPDDQDPGQDGLERVVSIDFHVEAVDGFTASGIANEIGRRHAARLSFLLGIGLYKPTPAHRWVVVRGNDDEGSKCQQEKVLKRP